MKNNNKKNNKGYFGPFYWNPKDKRIFVPKSWGYGWTVNFANPSSILALFSMLVIILVLVRFL